MSFSVRSFKVAELDVPGPEVFWMSDWDVQHPLWFQVVLVQGHGVTALVNTGPAAEAEEGLPFVRRPDETIAAILERAEVAPADVTHVLLTPLQLYTTGNIRLFENATVCLAKRGWVHFHTTHSHPHDERWASIGRDDLVYLVSDAWDRVRLLEDEDEIVPGLRTWWSGVHHRASMVVEVDSADGLVAISDSFFYYENVEEGRVLGISESMEEALDAYRRVRSTARHIVPLYDPKVFDRYPGGIVSPA